MPGKPSEFAWIDVMTESPARPSDRAAGRPDEAERRKPQAPAADAPPAPVEQAAPADPLAEAAREAAEYKDKLLRTLGERVLRPALVAVAKSPPKPAANEPPANDNAGTPPPDAT